MVAASITFFLKQNKNNIDESFPLIGVFYSPKWVVMASIRSCFLPDTGRPSDFKYAFKSVTLREFNYKQQ